MLRRESLPLHHRRPEFVVILLRRAGAPEPIRDAGVPRSRTGIPRSDIATVAGSASAAHSHEAAVAGTACEKCKYCRCESNFPHEHSPGWLVGNGSPRINGVGITM